MEDSELGSERDTTAGKILSGNHEQLHEYMRAGLWRNFGGVHFHRRQQRDSGERDGGRDAEQWDHDSGGQSDGGDDYGVGDSLGFGAGAFLVEGVLSRQLSDCRQGASSCARWTAEGGCPTFGLLVYHTFLKENIL